MSNVIPPAAATHWCYDDVYQTIVKYIHLDLNQTQYVLNFSVIALCITNPRAMVRFTLQSLNTNQCHQWETILNGYNLEELYNSVYTKVEARKQYLH